MTDHPKITGAQHLFKVTAPAAAWRWPGVDYARIAADTLRQTKGMAMWAHPTQQQLDAAWREMQRYAKEGPQLPKGEE